MKQYIKTSIFLLLSLLSASIFAASVPKPVHITFSPYKITALSDGKVSVPLQAYQGDKNYQKAEKKILKEHGMNPDKKSILVSLNAYLIQYKGKNILVDTGSGGLLPPKQDNGFLLKSLKADNIKPSQINAILITHMHPDHIGGLVSTAGKKVYPNATIYINEAAVKYWLNTKAEQQAPAFMKSWFTLAKKVLKVYHGHIALFANKRQKLFDKIIAIPLPGHTPGHTGYYLKAKDGKELLIWGDTVHVGMFEFAHPSWTMIFDVNRAQAEKEHIQIMNWCAKNHILVAGMHLAYPGFGYVIKQDKGFKFKAYH